MDSIAQKTILPSWELSWSVFYFFLTQINFEGQICHFVSYLPYFNQLKILSSDLEVNYQSKEKADIVYSALAIDNEV